MAKTLFLPGAGGAASFWKPVADRLESNGEFFSWPGLGNEPPEAGAAGLDDLVAKVLDRMSEPVDIVAQSMGGFIALAAALAAPEKVERLVLTVTSGGLPVADLGGADWRADYFRAFPRAAKWIAEPVEDLSARLPSIAAPTLLLWGDRDPISPVAVGERLRALLPDARLHVIPGAGHDAAITHADIVASLIARHLTRAP
ncbi:alpha/beta fold hydrolase [Methylosinus sp. Sm6]|uniref:alpha/beta fold hydrolase n=1 Tax=Methylosinus sp. Sm6 TaxID=2866948 RepID=UPI001C993B8D|nr:alpha/beta fold hydrolase [Methylosinus sp. Sm6]MBY6242530.1 alpha/beta hydrolase [Methylosinus sp. Sm6]